MRAGIVGGDNTMKLETLTIEQQQKGEQMLIALARSYIEDAKGTQEPEENIAIMQYMLDNS